MKQVFTVCYNMHPKNAIIYYIGERETKGGLFKIYGKRQKKNLEEEEKTIMVHKNLCLNCVPKPGVVSVK